MAHDFISLAIIAVVAFVAPVIAGDSEKAHSRNRSSSGFRRNPRPELHEPYLAHRAYYAAFRFGPRVFVLARRLRNQPENAHGHRRQKRPAYVAGHLRIRAGARVLTSEFGHRRHRSGSHGHRACDHGARNAHAHFARARAHEYESRPRGYRIRHLGRSRPGARHGGAALHAHELADCSDSRRIHDPVHRHRPRARHGPQKRHAPLQISRSKSKHHLANIGARHHHDSGRACGVFGAVRHRHRARRVRGWLRAPIHHARRQRVARD